MIFFIGISELKTLAVGANATITSMTLLSSGNVLKAIKNKLHPKDVQIKESFFSLVKFIINLRLALISSAPISFHEKSQHGVFLGSSVTWFRECN